MQINVEAFHGRGSRPHMLQKENLSECIRESGGGRWEEGSACRIGVAQSLSVDGDPNPKTPDHQNPKTLNSKPPQP